MSHHHLAHIGLVRPKSLLINIASLADLVNVLKFHTVAFIDALLLFIMHWFFLAPASSSLILLISLFFALSAILFQFAASVAQLHSQLSVVTATNGLITNQKYFSEISRATIPMP